MRVLFLSLAFASVVAACSGAPANAICELDDECDDGLSCIETKDAIGGGGACSSALSGLKICSVECTEDDDCDDVQIGADIDRDSFVCVRACGETPGYCTTRP